MHARPGGPVGTRVCVLCGQKYCLAAMQVLSVAAGLVAAGQAVFTAGAHARGAIGTDAAWAVMLLGRTIFGLGGETM